MADKGARILWVEDDAGIASLYIVRMEMEGFQVDHYEDGEKALHALEEFTPDLILLDLMLPGASGFDILDKLRSKPQTANTKVVVLSALGRPEEIERAMKLGSNEFVVKSQISLDELMQKLRGHMGLPSDTQPAAQA
ncbi:MAG TPA: response regulator [Candidatus Saccharimonadales bacterium]|nr:response regulator [Candidatus Saccharimonadales bacterium]